MKNAKSSFAFGVFLWCFYQQKTGTLRKAFPLCTQGGNRTHTLLPDLDFESSASTNSATWASGAAVDRRAKLFICLKAPKQIHAKAQDFIERFWQITLKINKFAALLT